LAGQYYWASGCVGLFGGCFSRRFPRFSLDHVLCGPQLLCLEYRDCDFFGWLELDDGSRESDPNSRPVPLLGESGHYWCVAAVRFMRTPFLLQRVPRVDASDPT